ncbi:MAG TPA: DUF5777 family beta-barrel protein [Bacteroidia bacterium]|nr:DUF5777 family beta-barrel protein [Bacteroidia bacterium]
MLHQGTRKKRRHTIIFFYFTFCLLPLISFSQEEKEYVFGTFRSSQLSNVQTTEMVQSKSFEFSIRHRFGMIGPDSTVYEQFLGFDLPANIRFAFVVPVGDKLNIGLGRTKNEKTFDGEFKYLLFRQTEDNKMPLTVAAYLNVAMKTNRFPKVLEYAFYSDGITPFTYKFNHRFSYCSELICARKFSEKFSMQITSVWGYKNLVSPGFENHMLSVPVSVMYKTGLHSSLTAEYAYRFNNRPSENDYPLSVAWEMGTTGHIFQLILSSSGELVEQEIYFKDGYNYKKGNLVLGFNIRRTFWNKKAQKKP